MHNKLPWIFVLVLLVGCNPKEASPIEGAAPASETDTLQKEQYSPPPWVIVSEMDFGQPTVSTKFRDQNYGIAIDLGGGIHITQDGGQTWTYMQDAALSRVALEIVDENLIWHIGWGGPVIRSLDGGTTWEFRSVLPFGGHFEYASFVDDQIGWAATTEMQKYWVTSDGAATWEGHRLPEGMGTVAALHLRTPQDVYFLDLAGNIFITTDAGASWETRSLGLAEGWTIPELNHSAVMRFTDSQQGVIALNVIGEGSSEVFALRTRDGGITWEKESLPVPMGMFHLTRDGLYLTHVDILNHGKFTLLRATQIASMENIPITRDLSVRKIQEGVFEFSHAFPWAANSLAVVMGDHLILVDTPWTPNATREMLTWLEDQVGPKQVVAINAHFHLDNLGGNAYLVEKGIPVYGSEMTAELLAERGQASLEQTLAWLQENEDPRFAQTLAELKLTAPTELFDLEEGLDLEFSGEHLQIYYPGPAHAPDNVVVYFPERKLLFGGCMIIGWDAIGNTADADLQAWPESVRKLEQFEFDILVPGHGERLDPGLLEHTLNLLANAQ